MVKRIPNIWPLKDRKGNILRYDKHRPAYPIGVPLTPVLNAAPFLHPPLLIFIFFLFSPSVFLSLSLLVLLSLSAIFYNCQPSLDPYAHPQSYPGILFLLSPPFLFSCPLSLPFLAVPWTVASFGAQRKAEGEEIKKGGKRTERWEERERER